MPSDTDLEPKQVFPWKRNKDQLTELVERTAGGGARQKERWRASERKWVRQSAESFETKSESRHVWKRSLSSGGVRKNRWKSWPWNIYKLYTPVNYDGFRGEAFRGYHVRQFNFSWTWTKDRGEWPLTKSVIRILLKRHCLFPTFLSFYFLFFFFFLFFYFRYFVSWSNLCCDFKRT